MNRNPAALLTVLLLTLSGPVVADDPDGFGYLGAKVGYLVTDGFDPYSGTDPDNSVILGLDALWLPVSESPSAGFALTYERHTAEYDVGDFLGADFRTEATYGTWGAALVYGIADASSAAYGGIGWAATGVDVTVTASRRGTTSARIVGDLGEGNSWYLVAGFMGGEPGGFAWGVNASYYDLLERLTLNLTLGYRF